MDVVVAVVDSMDAAAVVDFVVGSMDAVAVTVVVVVIAVVFACTAAAVAVFACIVVVAVGSFEAELTSVDLLVLQSESVVVLEFQAELKCELAAAVAGLDVAVEHCPSAVASFAAAAEAVVAAFAAVEVAAVKTAVVAELG